MSFFSSIRNFFRRDHGTLLVLDIGGSSIKAAVIKIEKEENIVRILGFYQEYFEEEILDAEKIHYENLKVTAIRAKFFAEKIAKIKTTAVIIGLADEFLGSLSLSTKQKRDNPQSKITPNELKNIFSKLKWQLKEKAKGIPGITNISIVHAAIQEVLIDGWRVTNPIGFGGKEMVLNVYYSYISEHNMDIFRCLAKDLNVRLLRMASRSYALVAHFIAEHGPDYSAIFADMSTYRTDLVLVQKGKILETKSLATGSSVFTKKIASDLAIGFFEAEQIKLKYSRGELSERVAGKIKDIMTDTVKLWQNGLMIAVKEFSPTQILPSVFMIYGGGAGLPDIPKVFRNVDWPEEANFARKPEIKVLDTKSFHQVLDATKLVARGSRNISFFALLWFILALETKQPSLPREEEFTGRP